MHRCWRRGAQQLGLPFPVPEQRFQIEHLPLAAPVTAGRLDPRNARYVLGAAGSRARRLPQR